MAFFQNSVTERYLKALDRQQIQATYTLFKSHFHNATIQENIRNSKEEQYQEGFLRDLFVSILGYTLNPNENFNLTTEYKNVKDAKKADGAIIISGKVLAVIELKGTDTTDLNKIENQAFGYKNNQPDCKYIITSNFEKIRFYIDNAIEHLEFNLFKITEKEFELLYLCLSKESIEKGIPKKIKDESLSEEDLITKNLYKDYSLFKRELHRNLVELNPDFDELLLFKKSQKLLDRFLFLFFAEDRQLLPQNSVRLVLSDWRELQDRDENVPLYSRFQKYFGYLNTGFKGKRYDVFAYNGGLFKPDEVLDNIKIDDELLYSHSIKLSAYDFESDVDVNILGHIFENSLNELDEIKSQLEGTDSSLGKSIGISKRKKDGVFYTPKYITKYIVENTVGKLCTEKKSEYQIVEGEYSNDKKRSARVKQNLYNKLLTYREWLLQLTICDPACGSGAFLNQALDFLITEHRYIDELQAKLFGDALVLSDVEKSILENNLFGVDINEESVEIAKLSLWLRTAQPNRKLNDLNNNIKCGNSLIDDPAVAGDKAFNWEKEFPQVFGYKADQEVIVTKIDELPDFLRLIKEQSLEAKIKSEQALALSKEAAELSQKVYEYAEKLEAVSDPETVYGICKQGFDVVIGNPPYGAKLDANTQKYLNEKYIKGGSETVISFIKLTYDNLLKNNGLFGFIIPKSFTFSSNYESIRQYILDSICEIVDCKKVWKEVLLEQSIIFIDKNKKYDTYNCGRLDKQNIEFVGSINKEYFHIFGFYLNDISNSELEIGLKMRMSNKYFGDIANNSRGGIFQNKISGLGNIDVLGGAEIQRYGLNGIKGKIEFDIIKGDAKCFVDENSVLVQNIVAHIENPVDHIKITAHLPLKKEFAIVDTINQLTFKRGYSNKVFWLILNSSLINWFTYRFVFARAIRTMHFDNSITNRIPVPINFTSDTQQPFIKKADQMLSLNNDLQVSSQKFQRTIQRKFDIEVLPNKLQNWYLLSYKEFIAELGKKKIKLSLSQEAEWEDYFLQKQQNAYAIKNQIEITDKEIDRMVYTLYELTGDEIKIVEGQSK